MICRPGDYHQLDLAERRTIFRLLNARTPVAVIARELGRHRATIHREISRNHFHAQREYAGYYPLNAQDLASKRRRRQRKLCWNQDLRDYIIAGLERCWSPEQIAGRLKHEVARDGTVCHETIYRYVYGPEGREAGLYRYLPRRVADGSHATAASRAPRPFPPTDRSSTGRPRSRIAGPSAIGRRIC